MLSLSRSHAHGLVRECTARCAEDGGSPVLVLQLLLGKGEVVSAPQEALIAAAERRHQPAQTKQSMWMGETARWRRALRRPRPRSASAPGQLQGCTSKTKSHNGEMPKGLAAQ
jgi:hypothetical protein